MYLSVSFAQMVKAWTPALLDSNLTGNSLSSCTHIYMVNVMQLQREKLRMVYAVGCVAVG